MGMERPQNWRRFVHKNWLIDRFEYNLLYVPEKAKTNHEAKHRKCQLWSSSPAIQKITQHPFQKTHLFLSEKPKCCRWHPAQAPQTPQILSKDQRRATPMTKFQSPNKPKNLTTRKKERKKDVTGGGGLETKQA